MDRIVYEYDDADARAFFEYAGHYARDARDALRRAGGQLLHHINLTFETEGGWIGEPWPPLNARYAERKMAKIGARPMLVFTGQLRSAAISHRAVKISRDAGGGRAVWSITTPYAEAHQHGYRGVPARPFLRVNRQLVEAIEGEFRDWLEDLKGRNRARRTLNLINPIA